MGMFALITAPYMKAGKNTNLQCTSWKETLAFSDVCTNECEPQTMVS